jgi:hypothetical protein
MPCPSSSDVLRSEDETLTGIPSRLPVRFVDLPCVGKILSMVLMLEIGRVDRFPTAAHLASYAGLVPRVHSSGGHTRMGQVCANVNRNLKWAFVEIGNDSQPGAHCRSLHQRRRRCAVPGEGDRRPAFGRSPPVGRGLIAAGLKAAHTNHGERQSVGPDRSPWVNSSLRGLLRLAPRPLLRIARQSGLRSSRLRSSNAASFLERRFSGVCGVTSARCRLFSPVVEFPPPKRVRRPRDSAV